MASVFLRLGILFAIAVTNLFAEGWTDPGKNSTISRDRFIDPGVVLVPGPHRIIVYRKTPLLLNCSLVVTNSSLKITKFDWYKDGNPIDFSRPRTVLFKNGSISIHPKRKKSEARRWKKLDGLYECVATIGFQGSSTGSQGSVIATRVEVAAVSIASSFSQEPSNQTVYVGGVAKFECNIKSVPRASYIWNKNITQLPQDDDRFQFLPSGVLHIRDVRESDAGRYCCQATPYLYAAIQGEVANMKWRISRQGELKVVPRSPMRGAMIVAGPKDTEAEAGQTVYLECLVDGWPRPKVIWKWKPNEIDKESKVWPATTSTVLKLLKVTPEHAGTYECVVSGQRKLKASAILNVTTPPKLIMELPSKSYPLAMTAVMKCDVVGNPQVNVSWYLNGNPLSTADVSYEISGQKVILYKLHRDNVGYYQCIANNSVGQVMALAYVKIDVKEGAPNPPENIQVIVVNSTTANVMWQQTLNDRPSLIFYWVVKGRKNGSPDYKMCELVNQDVQNCSLSELEPDTDYCFNIQTFNSRSGSDLSENFFFKTKKDMLKRIFPLFNVETMSKFYSVNVSWQPVPDDFGETTFYSIYYHLKGGGEEESYKVSGSKTSFILTGLESDAVYDVVVMAVIGKSQPPDRSKWPWKSFHTSKANASNSFMVKFVNSTSVLLQWERPAMASLRGNAITGYTIALRDFDQKQTLKEIDLPIVNSHILTRLDEEMAYEVILKARNGGAAKRIASQQFKILDLHNPLIPVRFWAEDVGVTSMELQWSAVPFDDVTYEVCYSVEFNTTSEICHLSTVTSYNLTDIQPYTRYELRIRSIQYKKKGEFSKNIIVQSGQTYPSPPMNVTVEVKNQGLVSLSWSPPKHPNGVVTSYIVQYGKESYEPSPQITWKKMTTSGKTQTMELQELDEVKYYFKVAATTIVGPGPDSEVKDIVPVCPPDATNCRKTKVVPLPGEQPDDKKIGDTRKAGIDSIKLSAIIVGVLIGIVLILVLLFFWCRRRCAKNRAPDDTAAPITVCPANGHILPLFPPSHNHNSRPGNGHAHHQLDQSFATILDHPESTTPMLQILENESSDSKGGNDSIVTPNGVCLNGFVRPNLWHGGQSPHYRYSGDLNLSQNSEEMQGLIKAMMASTDGKDFINGSDDTALMMSSLDDMNRGSHTQKAGDHSSEDSGTGCHRMGTNGRCNGDMNSPASSPSGSSGINSSLGRRHLFANREGGGGSWGDEMGGMVLDPATGTVIGMANSPSASTQLKEGEALKEVAEEEEDWSHLSGHEAAEDAHTANDRDSGHDSEIKAHSMCANSSEEENFPALGLGTGSDLPKNSNLGSCAAVTNIHPCNQSSSSRAARETNNLPPPPPSPPRSPPSLPPPSSSSSSQQLSSSSSNSSRNVHNSNKLPQNDRPGHHRNHHRRTNRLHLTPVSKLPCPPPPPPISALSPPPPPPPPTQLHCLASEDKPIVDKEGTGRSRNAPEDSGNSSSINVSRQTSSLGADVVFGQPAATTPSPSHVV